MSFERGWRARRAAAQHRAAVAKCDGSEYRRWMQAKRENERRLLQELPPLTVEPEQKHETVEEAKERRVRDAIVLPNTLEEIEAAVEAVMNLDRKRLN